MMSSLNQLGRARRPRWTPPMGSVATWWLGFEIAYFAHGPLHHQYALLADITHDSANNVRSKRVDRQSTI